MVERQSGNGLAHCRGAFASDLSACSVKRTAVNIVGNALSGGGVVYASDDDPELIREAIPFGLKTFESPGCVARPQRAPPFCRKRFLCLCLYASG